MGEYQRNTTPELQRIANDGTTTSECFAHSQYTLSSSASILTGTYPTHHTVGVTGDAVPKGLPTVPELFADAGYYTACLSRNSHISSATNLDRGFQQFEWIAASTLLKAVSPLVLAKYFRNIRSQSAGFTLDTAKHATPYLINETAKRWLRSFVREQEPFFFYLHYNEPHRPYYPPLPYLDEYTGDLDVSPDEAARIAMDVHSTLYERVARGFDLTDDELEALVAMYDAEIRYTDEQVGRLFEFVKSLDLDETVFIVTADHGELFGEHDLLAHKFVLDDAIINVPLVVHGMDLDLELGSVVQHMDVMKTLCARAGGDAGQLQGVNLERETREYAIAQRGPANFQPFLDENPEFDTSRFHESTLTALRTTEFKYQRSDGRSELYSLPDETKTVADTYPEVAAHLDDELTEFLATCGKPVSEGSKASFSEGMKRQLRDLGYVG